MSSSLSKRKLDDYTGDSTSPTDHIGATATRMRKDQTDLASPSSCRSPLSDPPRLQFFVRMLSGLNLVLHASSIDTILTVHEMIQSSTRIPIIEQRLIYCGKQLQQEQTLEECGVENDAALHLTGKMRSTGYPKAWLISEDIRKFIFFLLQNNPPVPLHPPLKTIKSFIDQLMYTVPEDDPNGTIGHLQIFATSLAPQAMVMLYISCHKPNREAADHAIRHFINLIESKTPERTHHQCVALVLEFCRLLSITAGFSDSLYIFCRGSLGTMLGYADIEERKGLIGLRDIFPFVKDIAGKVAISLVLSPDSHRLSGPSLEDVRDFSAFLGPVRKEIKKSVLFSGSIRIPFGEEISMVHVGHVEEISYFHWFFHDLLGKMNKCLAKYEEDVDWVVKHDCQAAFTGWSQHLTILKELHSISKLYYGCEELFWETMKRRKDAVCYLIVKHAKRSDDNKWILECKEVTNFEARRHLSMLMLPEVKYEYGQLYEMLIDRSHLLAESFEYIVHADLHSLRSGLFMEFKNEEATGPGVLREWFLLVCQEIFNTQNALFVACPNDRRRFFPNPASKVDPLHLQYFSFSGRVIALALMHKVQVGIVFDRVFFLQLAGQSISLEDIREADPYLYSSCKQILDMDPEAVDQDALGLTFVNEVDELGTKKIVELIPNGKTVVVNSKNRKQYVDALIQHCFVVATREQMNHFAQGLADIMSCQAFKRSFFNFLEPEDLDYMLRGSESEISIDDWKLHTDYHGFKETDPQISWFWKVVGGMTKEQKKILLFFWTSIKHLPVEGFKGLASRVYIYRTSEPSDRLPSSHTCFYRICFPKYPSLSVTNDRLQIITQEHVGCSFGTW